jgi:crotonobetainyl-CoA:carnitine CoA-transferase CaiB-like acyl-CoA transferase
MTVVEVTSRLQGPLAGMLLRRLGAQVVKVEPPGGDFGRYSPPLAGGTGAAYLAYNGGKRVVEIDYKQPSGLAELRELAVGADVFLHNWRPGRAASLGVDSIDLGRVNPRLVYASASGWGDATDAPGPIAGDFIVQAYAGTGSLLHPPGVPPLPSRLTLLDVTGGLLAAAAVLAGLHERERTGCGHRVDTSLVGAAAALATSRSARWTAWDRPVRTTAGHLVVCVDDPHARRQLATACALPAWTDDRAILARLADRPAEHWVHDLRAAGLVATAVRENLAGLPSDPRLAGLLERADDACWVPAAPWSFHV